MNHTVLIVEDMRAIAFLQSKLLEKWGYECLIARNGQEALHLLQENSPAVILLDLGLPDMNGIQLAKAIRKDLNNESVWIIALTGSGEKCEDFHAIGIDRHLLKPIEPADLRKFVEYYCESPRQGELVVS